MMIATIVLMEANNLLPGLAVLGGVIVLVVVFALLAARAERRRLEALQEIATRLGMTFDKDGERARMEHFASFPLFTTGRRQHASALMTGLLSRVIRSISSPESAGMHVSRSRMGDGSASAARDHLSGEEKILLFDYRYTTGGGKHSHTHHQTVAAVRLPGRALPRFTLRPENVFHRIGAAFGYQNINFDSAPEFSKKWLLRGEDETAIRAFFQPRLIEALEQREAHGALEPHGVSGALEPLSIEAGGDWIVVYHPGRRAKPDQIESLIDGAREIAAIFARSQPG